MTARRRLSAKEVGSLDPDHWPATWVSPSRTRPLCLSTATRSWGARDDSRESHRAPSEHVESSASEYVPSWVMARPRSASYHWPFDTAPNEPIWGPSTAGRAFQVIDSFHAFDEIEKTRPPTGEESIW